MVRNEIYFAELIKWICNTPSSDGWSKNNKIKKSKDVFCYELDLTTFDRWSVLTFNIQIWVSVDLFSHLVSLVGLGLYFSVPKMVSSYFWNTRMKATSIQYSVVQSPQKVNQLAFYMNATLPSFFCSVHSVLGRIV